MTENLKFLFFVFGCLGLALTSLHCRESCRLPWAILASLSSITQTAAAATTPAGQSQPLSLLDEGDDQRAYDDGMGRWRGRPGRAATPHAFTPRAGRRSGGRATQPRTRFPRPASARLALNSAASGLQPRAQEDPPDPACLPACMCTGHRPYPVAVACLPAWRCSHLPSSCLFFCLAFVVSVPAGRPAGRRGANSRRRLPAGSCALHRVCSAA